MFDNPYNYEFPSQQDYERFGQGVFDFSRAAYNDVANKFRRAQEAATPVFDFFYGNTPAGQLLAQQNERRAERYLPPRGQRGLPDPPHNIRNTGMHPVMRGGMTQEQIAQGFRQQQNPQMNPGVVANSPPARQAVQSAVSPGPTPGPKHSTPRSTPAPRLQPRASGDKRLPSERQPATSVDRPSQTAQKIRHHKDEATRLEHENRRMDRQDANRKAAHVPLHIQRKARALGYTGDFSDFDPGAYKDLKAKKRTERMKAHQTEQEERRRIRKAKYGSKRRQTGTERNRNRTRLGFAPDHSDAGRRRRQHESDLALMRAIRGR